jgi:NhaA family Na+:H+ antiporter
VLVQPLQRFLDTEASGGIVLLVAAAVAIVWANTSHAQGYHELWSTEVSVGVGSLHVSEDLRHWINDLGMALFFFVAGLEIKREMVHGDLRSPRAATLPIACAVGGMVVPAFLYWRLASAGDGAGGWGIPMATDIAFAIGVLALVGRRVPASLRVFLLTLAIVDDLGAIVVIAVFYSDHLSVGWLAGAATAVVVISVLKRLHVRSLIPYGVLAAILWFTTYQSGAHATLAGVVLGLLTPATPFHHPRDVQHAVAAQLSDPSLADDEADEYDEHAFVEVARISREAISPVGRLEPLLHPWSSFVVLPLFALANAGIVLDPASLTEAAASDVSRGVVVGLVAGKPLGIVVAALIVVKLAGGSLPRNVGWLELAGAGALGGIGFTVSLFITDLAFSGSEAAYAKVAILAGSVTAGLVGAALLLVRRTPEPLTPGP